MTQQFGHTYLRPGLDPLGDVLHLVYYDHRGNGRSGRPPIETLTHEQYAADADALREYLGFNKTVVIGHSAGGWVALPYALLFPQHLSHLILIDTSPAWDYGEKRKANVERKGITPEIRKVWDGPEPSTVAEFERMLKVLGPLYWYRFDEKLAEQLFSKTVYSLEASKRDDELMKNYSVVSRLGEIQVPTLILVGRDDWVCPPSQAERMHKGILKSELVIFERSGHMPFVEEPDAFLSAIRGWLART